MEIALIFSALGLGFLSGFHCIGMCGPIALSLGLTKREGVNFYLQNFTYQLGRVFTYAFLGAIFGLLGEGLMLAGFQRYLTMAVGVVMILMAIFSYQSLDFSSKIPFLSQFLLKVKIQLGKLLQKTGYSSRFLTGVLNGFLPCGVVYIALTASLGYGGVKNGAVFMAFFGLGTLPFMFLMVLLGSVVTTKNLRHRVMKIIPVVMILMGGFFILRGLQLGIPYLSPKEEALQIAPKKSCCSEQSCH